MRKFNISRASLFEMGFTNWSSQWDLVLELINNMKRFYGRIRGLLSLLMYYEMENFDFNAIYYFHFLWASIF